MTDHAKLDDLAKHLAGANYSSWTSLGDECYIELSGALGTKPFWRRLARAAQEYFQQPVATGVVSGKLEWRGHMLLVGRVRLGYIRKYGPAVWRATFPDEISAKGDFLTESEARAAVEQAVRVAIAGGKGETK